MSIDFPSGGGGGGGISQIEVADITARDTLTVDENVIVYVIDATDDPTVNTGGARYQWNLALVAYLKLTEQESLEGTQPIVHLGDGILTSFAITDLNTIYYIKTGATLTTATVPDSSVGNPNDTLKIFKDLSSSAGNLSIVTTTAQNIGGETSQLIANEQEGISIASDPATPTDWLIFGDSRTNKTIVATSAAYAATETWELDFLNIGHATDDLDATLLADLTVFEDGRVFTITNSGSALVYVRVNGNTINGEVRDYRIASDGYLRLAYLSGALQITGNYKASRDIDLAPIAGSGVLIDATDLSTYTASASIKSITSLDSGGKVFGQFDRLGVADTNMEIGYNASGTPSGRPSFVFTGAANRCLRMVGNGTIHDNVSASNKGLYMCIARKTNANGDDALISQYRNSSSDRTFLVGGDLVEFSKSGGTPQAGDSVNYSPNLKTWDVIEVVWDNFNKAQMTISGVNAGEADNVLNTISVQTEPLTLGGIADNNTANLFNGELCVLVASDTIPSDADRKLIREKLADKIGVDLQDSIPNHEILRRNPANNNVFMRHADDRLSVDYTEDGTINKVFTATDDTKLAGIETGATADQIASEVPAAIVPGATYNTVQHMQDIFHSSGWTSGGALSNNGDGTIDVSAGTGLIRATDDSLAPILFTDFPALASLVLTDNSFNYIYVEYNAGVPQVIATATERTDQNTNFLLGGVYRSVDEVHLTSELRTTVGDHALRMINRLNGTMPFGHDSGASLSETGTRNIAVTAGKFWLGLNGINTIAQDTSGASPNLNHTFENFYYNGSAWVTNDATVAVAAFTGAGLDDGTSGGTFVGSHTIRLHVEITATGANDTYKWSYLGNDGVTVVETTGVPITAGAITLVDGATITFAATTGHTSGDAWDFDCTLTSQINNTQYNDIATGLVTLANNNYGVHWVYMDVHGHVAVLFGQASYTLSQAADAVSPSSVPAEFQGHSRLIGRIIIGKGDATFADISNNYASQFQASLATDHNSTAGLQGGTASEYFHLTSAEHAKLIVIEKVVFKAVTLPYTVIATDLGKTLKLSGTGLLTLTDGLDDGFTFSTIPTDVNAKTANSATGTLNTEGGPTGVRTLGAQNSGQTFTHDTGNSWFGVGAFV